MESESVNNKCTHSCGNCPTKLLTETSKRRKICSDCIIGNCKGKGLFNWNLPEGRFETAKIKRGYYEIPKQGERGPFYDYNITEAYPFSMEAKGKEGESKT